MNNVRNFGQSVKKLARYDHKSHDVSQLQMNQKRISIMAPSLSKITSYDQTDTRESKNRKSSISRRESMASLFGTSGQNYQESQVVGM